MEEIVKINYLNWQNAAQTLLDYCRNHGFRRGPCTVKPVQDLIHKFEETSCTCDRTWSGWPANFVETVQEVHQTISTVLPASSYGVSRVLNLPNWTVRKILCSVLNMFPFRFQRVQMLEEGDNQLRLDFANKFLIHYDEDNSWPLSTLLTDEAHFTLTGNVNSKNCVYWTNNNSHECKVPWFGDILIKFPDFSDFPECRHPVWKTLLVTIFKLKTEKNNAFY